VCWVFPAVEVCYVFFDVLVYVFCPCFPLLFGSAWWWYVLWECVELSVIPLCGESGFVVCDVLVGLDCLCCVVVVGVWVVVPFEVAFFVCCVGCWSVVDEWFEVYHGYRVLFGAVLRSFLIPFLVSACAVRLLRVLIMIFMLSSCVIVGWCLRILSCMVCISSLVRMFCSR